MRGCLDETGLWAGMEEVILTAFLEVGRLAHCEQCQLLAQKMS